MAKMATGYLYLNTRDELIRLDCSKIVYMEGDGNYTNIVLVNKQKVSVCMNLSHILVGRVPNRTQINVE